MTSKEVIELIESEKYPEQWISQEKDGQWWITSEWLVGVFAARAFVADSKEKAAQQLIEYFDRHIGHDSLVGIMVRESGWPSVLSVKRFIHEQWSPPQPSS